MLSPWQLRDAIFGVLIETYTDGGKTDWWSYNGVSLQKETTTAILAQVALAYMTDGERGEYERRNLFNSIHNIIWTTFPGGTTAFGAAAKIAPLLNIEVPDKKNY